jgi:hypothetical protein
MSDILSGSAAINQTAPPLSASKASAAEGDTGTHNFSFGDLIDVINPLQHIPGVASVYRAVTGDMISDPARFMGSMLFTGPIGLALTAVDTLAMNAEGQRPSDQLIAAFRSDDPSPAVVADIGASNHASRPQSPAPNAPPAPFSALGPNLPSGPAISAGQIQNINGSLLDNFIKSQGQNQAHDSGKTSLSQSLFAAADPSHLAAVTTPITRAAPAAHEANAGNDTTGNIAPRLAPPTAVNSQSGTELSSWMMRALDQYKEQAQNRPTKG